MHRIWTVALTTILVSAPSITGLLLSSCESARVQYRECTCVPRTRRTKISRQLADTALREQNHLGAITDVPFAAEGASITSLPVGENPATRADASDRPYCRHQQNGSESARVRSRRTDCPPKIRDATAWAVQGRAGRLVDSAGPTQTNTATRADDLLWFSICEVESNNDPTAYNPKENAAGIAQIRPILVEDVNRILGFDGYSLSDRYDPTKSREMFDIYQEHYCRSGKDEEMARMWCSGPRGMSKAASLPYWRKVKAQMERLR